MRCANGKCSSDRFRITTLQYQSYEIYRGSRSERTNGEVLPIEVECMVCGYKGTPTTMGMEVPIRILELTAEELHFGSETTPPLPFPIQQVCAYLLRQNMRMQSELERLGLPWSLFYMSADADPIPEQEQGEYQITIRLTETRANKEEL